MQRFWAIFADALTYTVFQVPAALVALGYDFDGGRRLSLDGLSALLGSTVGRVFVVFVLIAVGLFFGRLVQITFRDLGEPQQRSTRKSK